MKHIIVAAIVFLAGSSATMATASAQDNSTDNAPTVEPTQGQLELNDRGVDAITAKDYKRAVRLFKASLDLGDLNITYVNMARAYQHDQQCAKADKNYVAALSAPRVPNPSADRIAAAVKRYRRELRTSCPGTLKLTCNPESIEVFVDGQGPLSCEAVTRRMDKGAHQVRGVLGDQSTETTVSVLPMTTSTVKLSLEKPPEVVSESNVESVDEPPEVEPANRDGIYWMSGGAAAIAGAVVLDVVPATASNAQLDAMDFVPVGLYAVGAGVIVWGMTQLFDG